MKARTITLKLEIPDPKIDRIMELALLYHPLWRDEITLIEPERYFHAYPNDIRPSHALTRGFVLSIHDVHNNQWHDLNIVKFLHGLKLAMEDRTFNLFTFDEQQADVVIQYALFGEKI